MGIQNEPIIVNVIHQYVVYLYELRVDSLNHDLHAKSVGNDHWNDADEQKVVNQEKHNPLIFMDKCIDFFYRIWSV